MSKVAMDMNVYTLSRQKGVGASFAVRELLLLLTL